MTPEQIKREQADAEFSRRVASYLFDWFVGLAAVSLVLTWLA